VAQWHSVGAVGLRSARVAQPGLAQPRPAQRAQPTAWPSSVGVSVRAAVTSPVHGRRPGKARGPHRCVDGGANELVDVDDGTRAARRGVDASVGRHGGRRAQESGGRRRAWRGGAVGRRTAGRRRVVPTAPLRRACGAARARGSHVATADRWAPHFSNFRIKIYPQTKIAHNKYLGIEKKSRKICGGIKSNLKHFS
jgi:hypothetical protein